MGLHLNYELRLPGRHAHDQVTATLNKLRTFALKLQFKRVSDLYEPGSGEGLRRLASVVAAAFADGSSQVLDIESVRGFSVWPGEGCETAAFAFMRQINGSGECHQWFWHSSCKTQYASVISDQHLVACHTRLVKLLECAQQMGVNVVVRDETGYWETRDERRLIEEVHAMNRFVARLAGMLSDQGATVDGQVHAPIFRHPRFERLEMGCDE